MARLQLLSRFQELNHNIIFFSGLCANLLQQEQRHELIIKTEHHQVFSTFPKFRREACYRIEIPGKYQVTLKSVIYTIVKFNMGYPRLIKL